MEDAKKFTSTKLYSFLIQELRNRMNRARRETISPDRAIGRLDELFEISDLLNGGLIDAIHKILEAKHTRVEKEDQARQAREKTKAELRKKVGVT